MNLDKLKDDLSCIVCFELNRTANSYECGHEVCNPCLIKIKTLAPVKQICSECSEPIGKTRPSIQSRRLVEQYFPEVLAGKPAAIAAAKVDDQAQPILKPAAAPAPKNIEPVKPLFEKIEHEQNVKFVDIFSKNENRTMQAMTELGEDDLITLFVSSETLCRLGYGLPLVELVKEGKPLEAIRKFFANQRNSTFWMELLNNLNQIKQHNPSAINVIKIFIPIADEAAPALQQKGPRTFSQVKPLFENNENIPLHFQFMKIGERNNNKIVSILASLGDDLIQVWEGMPESSRIQSLHTININAKIKKGMLVEAAREIMKWYHMSCFWFELLNRLNEMKAVYPGVVEIIHMFVPPQPEPMMISERLKPAAAERKPDLTLFDPEPKKPRQVQPLLIKASWDDCERFISILSQNNKVRTLLMGMENNFNQVFQGMPTFSKRAICINIRAKLNNGNISQAIDEFLTQKMTDNFWVEFLNRLNELKETYPALNEIIGLFISSKSEIKKVVTKLSVNDCQKLDEEVQKHSKEFIQILAPLGPRLIEAMPAINQQSYAITAIAEFSDIEATTAMANFLRGGLHCDLLFWVDFLNAIHHLKQSNPILESVLAQFEVTLKEPEPAPKLQLDIHNLNRKVAANKGNLVSSFYMVCADVIENMPTVKRDPFGQNLLISARKDPINATHTLFDLVVQWNCWNEFLEALTKVGMHSQRMFHFNV